MSIYLLLHQRSPAAPVTFEFSLYESVSSPLAYDVPSQRSLVQWFSFLPANHRTVNILLHGTHPQTFCITSVGEVWASRS